MSVVLRELQRVLGRYGFASELEGDTLRVGDARFTAKEAACLLRALLAPPRVGGAKSTAPAFCAFGLLEPLMTWWEAHEERLSEAQNRLLEQLATGAINPVEAQSWALIRGWIELAQAIAPVADAWLREVRA